MAIPLAFLTIPLMVSLSNHSSPFVLPGPLGNPVLPIQINFIPIPAPCPVFQSGRLGSINALHYARPPLRQLLSALKEPGVVSHAWCLTTLRVSCLSDSYSLRVAIPLVFLVKLLMVNMSNHSGRHCCNSLLPLREKVRMRGKPSQFTVNPAHFGRNPPTSREPA